MVAIRTVTFLLLATLMAATASAIPGQPGTLDATWATSSTLGPGKAIALRTTLGDTANAMAIQPDGKVLISGTCNTAGSVTTSCTARFNTDGTLDSGFGGSGFVTTAFAQGDSTGTGVAVQQDGKIVVVGACKQGATVVTTFCALRYTTNGVLDSAGFGGGGQVTSAIGFSSAAAAVAVQPDGKIVVVGSCGSAMCVARYNSNGVLDAGFGSGGSVTTVADAAGSAAYAAALQPDGKIVVAGSCGVGGTQKFCTLRYTSLGVLDGGFNVSGVVATTVGPGYSYARGVTVQPDGKIIAAGECYGAFNYDFCTARYNTDGSLDASYGAGGKTATDMVFEDGATAIAMEPSGKIVVVGNTRLSQKFGVLRYNSDGSLDTTWAGTGTTSIVMGTTGAPFYYGSTAVALQADGKVLLAGSCNSGGRAYFCAARFEGGPFGHQNCKLDIDGDGQVLATTDALVHARIALGMTGPAVIGNINFPANATRKTWPLIRDYLVAQCGMVWLQ